MPVGQAKIGLLGGIVDLGQLEFITNATADGTSNSITFTNIKEDEYAVHLLVGTELTNVGGNSHMNCRLSTDGGSSFDTSANYDKAAQYGNSLNNDKGDSKYQNDNEWEYFCTTDNSSTSATCGSYTFFYNLGNTRYSLFTNMHSGNNGNNSSLYYVYQSGYLSVGSVHNAFTIFASSASHKVKGKFTLYGLKGVPT